MTAPDPLVIADDVRLWEGLTPPYRTVVADPPWTYEVRPTGLQGGPRKTTTGGGIKPPPYPMMNVEDIAALPVGELVGADAHLYLWTTNRYLRSAHDVAVRWGFRHSQTLIWCKPPRGLGPGGAYANTTEFILFCRRGRLQATARSDTSWWLWPRGKHSVKPAEFFEVVENVSPGPYLDLFARGKRLGWDGWGNEYGSAA